MKNIAKLMEIKFNESISGGYVAIWRYNGKSIILGRSDKDTKEWRKDMELLRKNYFKPKPGGIISITTYNPITGMTTKRTLK